METQVTEPSSTEDGQSAGLLDGISADTNEGQQVNPSKTEISHLNAPEEDDDSPLERPDWWPENFWKSDDSAPDLEGIAKSWSDLRKQIAQGKHKPPTDGKYDTAAFGDIPEDDPVRQHVMGWAKEYGISQAALDKLVGDVVSMNINQAEQISRTIKQERAALGPNADAIIRSMIDWGNGMQRKGILSKDDLEEFKIMGGTAAGLRVFMKMREAFEGMKIPLQSAPVEGAPSKDELYAMVADPKYQSDPAYRAKVEKMFQQNFA